MMANTEHEEFELSTSLCEENEAAQCLTETGTITQAFDEDTTMASSVGDERYLLDENSAARESSLSFQDTRVIDGQISLIEKQLHYLLSKADELQTQLLWRRDGLQNYGFVNIVPMFLQTCQPYFTYLESTARNSNTFHPPLSTCIRKKLLQFSQQLCSRLEQLVLLYASFSFFSLEESDPLSISHFYIGQFQIDNMKVSIFRYCCPTPFLASANTGLYKCMRWNVEQEIEGEGDGKTYNSAVTEFYFLCCEDVIEAVDNEDEDAWGYGENAETERENKVSRIWSVGRWIQTFPDPNTEDITDWVLCSVPCGQYKQMLCLGGEEPSSCTATDCLLAALLSQETDGTSGMST